MTARKWTGKSARLARISSPFTLIRFRRDPLAFTILARRIPKRRYSDDYRSPDGHRRRSLLQYTFYSSFSFRVELLSRCWRLTPVALASPGCSSTTPPFFPALWYHDALWDPCGRIAFRSSLSTSYFSPASFSPAHFRATLSPHGSQVSGRKNAFRHAPGPPQRSRARRLHRGDSGSHKAL